MTEKKNGLDKPQKQSDDSPVTSTGPDLLKRGKPLFETTDGKNFSRGMPPMKKKPPFGEGNFPDNFEMPKADIAWVRRKYLDVPYANQSSSQKLDLYLPDEGDGPFPVIFYIHGGGWQIGDKRDGLLEPMLNGIKRGYALVSINYRLSSEEIFPAQIYDVKTALRFIKGMADEYSLDKDRVAAWGASSGGHLSALLGTSPGCPDLEDLSTGYADENTKVLAVIDWFGPAQDFLEMDSQLIETGNGVPDHSLPQSPESCLLGEQITRVPELVKKASPMTYITSDAPNFLIQHGYHDQLVPVQQSIEFAAQLEKIAGKDRVTLDVFMDHVHHADPYFSSDENLERVFAFLDQHLGKEI